MLTPWDTHRRPATQTALVAGPGGVGDGEAFEDGSSLGGEVWDDASDAANLCADAFEAVWTRAIPHSDYEIH